MTPTVRGLARRLASRRLRNWLRSPTQSLRWLWDEARHRAGLNRRVELRPGWTLICHPAAYRCAYAAQVHDPEQRAELAGYLARCQPGMILFDVGAHFGIFSLAALHYGGPASRAVAVDPSPTAVRMMRLEARLNGVEDRLSVLEAAASDHAGTVPLVAVGVQASGYYVPPTAGHTGAELTPTRAVTVDQLAAEFGLAPTHVKVDVEGAEAAVLRGAERVLRTKPGPLLFLELHNRLLRSSGEDPADILRWLREREFALLDHHGQPLAEGAVLSRELVRLIAQRL